MPNVFSPSPDGYRFFFYSNEGTEPVHVHIEKGGARCKWWMEPVRLAWNDGFSKTQLKAIRTIIDQRGNEIVEAWFDHFDRQ